jgi:hypothetical protein
MEGRVHNLAGLNPGRSLDKSCHVFNTSSNLRAGIDVVSFGLALLSHRLMAVTSIPPGPENVISFLEAVLLAK